MVNGMRTVVVDKVASVTQACGLSHEIRIAADIPCAEGLVLVVEILNNKFRISGIVERGKGGRKFVPLNTLQDLIGAKDKATVFYLKLDDPANAER